MLDNLIEITPNCFIIRTQAGFNKLLKKIGCKGQGDWNYDYKILQITNDKAAIDYIKTIPQCDSDTGAELYNNDGTPKLWKIKYWKQYPIKYPCILSFQDNTFETSTYTFYIRYIKDDMKVKEFVSYDYRKILEEDE